MTRSGTLITTHKREYLNYLAPAVIILFVITIFPTIFLYVVSLTDYDISQKPGELSFVGLKNYWYLFTIDKDFWKSILLTVVFTISSVTIEVILGAALALLFDSNKRFRRLKISLIIIPMVTTPAIIALIWKLILNSEYGVLNYLIRAVGLEGRNWLSVDNAFISLIFIDIWQWTPYILLMTYSGLQTVSQDQIEAAAIDGASFLKTLRYIILPHISPLMAIAILLKTIESLKSFDIVYGLTQGGPGNATELMALHIYRLGFKQTHWIGRASANAIILLFLTIPAVTFLSKKIRYSRENT